LFGFILKGLIGDNLIDERSLLWFLLKTFVNDVYKVLVNRHWERRKLFFEDLLLECLRIAGLKGLLSGAELVKNHSE